MNRPLLAIAAAAGALVLIFGTAGAAFAHDGLIASSPAAGSAVTDELSAVDLTFSQDFLTIGGSTAPFAVQVQGPDGGYANRGCVALEGGTITTGVELGDSGTYTVLWQVVSSDGHTISDTFTFSYTRPSDVEPVAGYDSGVTCDANTGQPIEPTAPSAEPTDNPSPSSAPVEQDNLAVIGPVIGFGGVVALFATVCIGFVVMLRLRRNSP